jgi:hypothetical protein
MHYKTARHTKEGNRDVFVTKIIDPKEWPQQKRFE